MDNDQGGYASVKRYVLRRDLKMGRESASRMSGGREFQRRGAERLKALDPMVVRRGAERLKALDPMVVKLKGGAVRWREAEDLRVRMGVLMCRRWESYKGGVNLVVGEKGLFLRGL